VQRRDVAGRREVIDEADVVIVGSGAGGATAARVLAGAGLDVIVIEEGPWVPPAERRLDAYGAFRQLWRDAGFQVAQGRSITPVLQGCCVGGSTTINGAIIHRLPEEVHAAWDAERGLGQAAPYAALLRAFEQIEAELHVGPAPEEVLGGNNRSMREGMTRLGLGGHVIQRNVRGCQGSARCNQGCPTGRKQSMDASFLPYAIERGARVYATCRADEIVTRRGRAVGVRGRFVDGEGKGPRGEFRARRAVIAAAGAIHTPLLLLASGVGKRSGLVGRRLQVHPATSVLGRFDERIDMWSGVTQGFETLALRGQGMKFETASVPLEILAARFPGFGPALIDLLADADRVAQWGVEVRARALGSVTPGPGGKPFVQIDLGPEDVALLKRGLLTLGRAMFAAGAREVMPGVVGVPARLTDPAGLDAILRVPDDPRHFHCITSHVFGTAVLGTDPTRSVVDPEGQSHEVAGLYVLDASIFPSNIGVNPQHSICGLTWVLSERLAARCS